MTDTKHTTKDGRRLYNVVRSSHPPAYPWRVSAALVPDWGTMEAADREADHHRAVVIESSPEVAALRARVAELEAERAPKPRDESVPPTSDGPAMQRLLDVRCHLRYIANDLHTSDRTAMHMQEVARECLEKTHSMRVLEREHEARVRADERARIAKELHRMAVAETESDARSAGLHEAAMFVESNGESAAPPASESLYRSNCPKKGHCVQGCLRTEPCRAEQAPTYGEVLAAAQRAAQEVESWPRWKRALSEPETPREKLRRDLDENAKRWASYPAEVRAVISTAEVFAVAPAEPAPDPWVLPEPLEWRHDTDGWYVTDGEYWLRLSYDNAGSVLRRRDDGDHLIDLIRRRNAAEPQGPA